MEQLEKTFPTEKDVNGFFFESAEDEEMNIRTAVYENGSKVKQSVLSNGKTAVVRELKGKDSIQISRLMGKDKERYSSASITLATKIDGMEYVIEDIENLKMKDYNLLVAMNSDLNF